MSENLLVGTHKTSNKSYRDNYDKIFGKKIEIISAEVQNDKNPLSVLLKGKDVDGNYIEELILVGGVSKAEFIKIYG